MNRDEILHVVTGLKVDYSGLFNVDDLINMIDTYFREHGYTKHVMSHKETRKKSGRTMSWRLRPFKQVKENKLEVQVWVNITDLVEVDKELDGYVLKLNKGKVNITLDAFVIGNMRGQWEARPEYTFIKTIFDKYLFQGKKKDYEGMARNDAVELRDEIASFLNLNKFLF